MSTTAFFNYNDFNTYADASTLTAVDTTSLANGIYAQVTNLGVYQLDKSSVATADGTTVIAGDRAGVNWIVNYRNHLYMNDDGEIDGSQIGAFSSASFANGTVGAPSITWANDQTDGWYRIGSHNEGYAINSAKIFDISATFVSVTTAQLAVPAGTAAAPSVTFTGDVNTGMYRSAADTTAFTGNGALIFSIAPTLLTVASGAQVSLPASSAASPAITLGGEQTGPYLVGAGSLGLSVAGTVKCNLTATALNMASGVALQVATVQVVGPRNTGWTTSSGTGTENQAALNVDTITATDANLQLIGQWLKGLTDALITHGLIGA